MVFDHFLDTAGAYSGTFEFDYADFLYPITIDWRENTADADIALYWKSSSQALEQISQEYLFSSATDIKASPFTITAV